MYFVKSFNSELFPKSSLSDSCPHYKKVFFNTFKSPGSDMFRVADSLTEVGDPHQYQYLFIQSSQHVGSINISSMFRGCLQYLVYRRRHRGQLIQYWVTDMSNTNISYNMYKNLLMWTSCLNLKNADRYFTRKKLKYY